MHTILCSITLNVCVSFCSSLADSAAIWRPVAAGNDVISAQTDTRNPEETPNVRLDKSIHYVRHSSVETASEITKIFL